MKLTRWKKNAKEFDVSISQSKNKDGSQSLICRIPKPVVESLGNPDSLVFKLGKNKVSVEAGNK